MEEATHIDLATRALLRHEEFRKPDPALAFDAQLAMCHETTHQLILRTAEQGDRRFVEVESGSAPLPAQAALQLALCQHTGPEVHETRRAVRHGFVGGQIRIVPGAIVLAVPPQAVELRAALTVTTLQTEGEQAGLPAPDGIGHAQVRLCVSETGSTSAIAEGVHTHA